MQDPKRLGRRLFVKQLGQGTAAVAVLGTAAIACSSSSDGSAVTSTTVATRSTNAGGSNTTVTSETLDGADAPSTTTEPGAPLQWERVNFDFVSAYVLARGARAAIIDTGTSGAASRFGDALRTLGLGWEGVDHVIITHLHNDHVGGLGEVLDEAAPSATAYAGAADVAGITSPRPLTGVVDGDEVFGLEIIGTPGHTPGHISVLDETAGLLVAGDALNEQNGRLVGPNPDFSDDIDLAVASAQTLATRRFEIALVGHGEPVTANASALLAEALG